MNVQNTLHILVIDEVGTSTVYKPVTYTDFVDVEADKVSIILITSKGAASELDKQRCLEVVELERPTTDGMVEIWAERLDKKHRIDLVYTKQEDIILRAAHIRKMLGHSTGFLRDNAILFRDKFAMKEMASTHDFPVPEFKRVYSPADIIMFTNSYGLPIIVKPTLGSASAGMRVIHTRQDLETYLEKEFYERIDDRGKVMDYSGDLIVEKFLAGCRMYHVNGYAKQGKLEQVWPFEYINTNFEFTMGKAYGNVFIPQTDPRWKKLVEFTQKLLNILPCPQHLMFHLELFEHVSQTGEIEFVLCEIAARRPGGSIALLIDLALGGGGFFPEIEFRLSNGLEPRDHGLKPIDPIQALGDLMIPKQIGKIVALPDPAACPVSGLKCHVLAKVGSVYTGFDIGSLNTGIRLVTDHSFTSTQDVQNALTAGHAWVQINTKLENVLSA